jgi:tungstate transport system ATP-binding protein
MSDAAAIAFGLSASREDAAPMLPLAMRGVSLSFGGAAVLEGIDLALGVSGCTMVLGPNGAGKSLLLKLMHGLVAPSSGAISWGGMAPGEVRARQALVFQKPVLLRRSVAANVDFVLGARGLPMERRAALLEHVGLAHKAGQPARLLSGGEAQRLALARALATEPEVLLLDEPTASLDPGSVLAIERIVSAARANGVRVIFVTHDVGQARRMADDVVFLHQGRIAEHTPAESFFDRPTSQAARNYLDGRIAV